MQPIDTSADDAAEQTQRLYRIVEDLPNEVRDLLVALEHSKQATDDALDAIGAAHFKVISGEGLDYPSRSSMSTSAVCAHRSARH